MSEIRTRPLFTLRLKVAQLQPVGATPVGRRVVGVVAGGTFEGERLNGTVTEGGSDWILVRPDGAYQLDVRLVLRTEDGHLIGMRYEGLRHGPAPVIERLNRGEKVDPSEYYFRALPLFETASDKYGWINRVVSIATGDRQPDGPIYRVFEVL